MRGCGLSCMLVRGAGGRLLLVMLLGSMSLVVRCEMSTHVLSTRVGHVTAWLALPSRV